MDINRFKSARLILAAKLPDISSLPVSGIVPMTGLYCRIKELTYGFPESEYALFNVLRAFTV